MQTIKIGKKDHPLFFGKSFIRKLEIEHGINVSDYQHKMKIEPVNTLLSIAFVALKEGCRRSKKEFFLTVDDISDYWDEDGTLIERVMDEFEASFKDQKADPEKKG